MPTISVIIPVFNGEKTILETIDSVLSQTFSDFELIIIDDGSQDKTLERLAQIDDSRVKVFSYPNAGVSVSRNRGIAQATGDYIAFLDADDLWMAEKLEAQLEALQKNSQAAVAYSWTNRIDEAGRFLSRGSYIAATGDVYDRMLLLDFLESGSNFLVRREALLKVGEFDASLPPCEDWELLIRLAAHYQFAVVPQPHILYRTLAQSASAQVLKMEAQALKVIDKAFAQAPDSLQYLKRYSTANIYKYLIFKALEGWPLRSQGIAAFKFLVRAIALDQTLLKAKVVIKVLLKSATVIFLPARFAHLLLKRMSWLYKTDTLLGYLHTDPAELKRSVY